MSGPTWRERLKPVELVGFAAVLGVFTGVVTVLATRDVQDAVILAGIAFIVALLVLAMLALAAGAPADPDDERSVLDRGDDARNRDRGDRGRREPDRAPDEGDPEE